MSMPPGSEYPDPNAQPPEPPTTGYSVPPQFTPPAYPGGAGDPLVLPPGADFGAWFTKVQEVAKRSWKSALIICTIGIAAPRAIVTLVERISNLAYYAGGTALVHIGDITSVIGSIILGFFVTLLFAIAASFVAAAGWAAGTWALVQEANGRPAGLGPAFQYGLKRAMGLWLWTVLVGLMVTIGTCACILPGIYLAFATSLFGFVAIFEKGQNPIGRSFQMTHANIGPTLGKTAIVGAIAYAYALVVGLIFGAIAVAAAIGSIRTTGHNFTYGIFEAIGTLLTGPAYAVALIGLLPIYTELRAREGSLQSSAQLQQELG
jgi:hypothetical protein